MYSLEDLEYFESKFTSNSLGVGDPRKKHNKKKRCCCGNHSASDGKKAYRGRQWQKKFTNKGGRRVTWFV